MFVFKRYSEIENKDGTIKNMIFSILSPIMSVYYLNFNSWFCNLFNNVGYELQPGREILYCEYNENIIGILILKNLDEKKICSVYVIPEHRGYLVGSYLFEEAFKILDCDNPLITVSEEKYNEFRRIFASYDFKLVQVIKDYYIEGNLEFVFNGKLE